jgi:hypothetical protein
MGREVFLRNNGRDVRSSDFVDQSALQSTVIALLKAMVVGE